MIRLHLQDDLTEGATVAPSDEQIRYLLTVMRCQIGDALMVFNGRDGEWRATVATASKRSASLFIETRTRPQSLPPDFELIIAMVKRSRLETIVEKAVELGATRVRLLLTHRTNQDRVNLARLHAIAVEAAEQTGRLDVPAIAGPQKFDALLETWPSDRTLMFCDEAGDDPGQLWGGEQGRAGSALDRLSATPQAWRGGRRLSPLGAWAVLIGPEGGFSPEERARLRSTANVVPVSLGPRILRADTAAIAAMVLWQAILGDWTAAEVS